MKYFRSSVNNKNSEERILAHEALIKILKSRGRNVGPYDIPRGWRKVKKTLEEHEQTKI
jgi:hypothetical protein